MKDTNQQTVIQSEEKKSIESLSDEESHELNENQTSTVEENQEEVIEKVDFPNLNSPELLQYVKDNVYSELINDLDGEEYFIENAGAPAVSMIFVASAKTGTAFALSSGAISGVVAGTVTGIQAKDPEQALKAAALAGSEDFKWGSI